MMNILFVVTSHGNIEGPPATGIWFSEFSEPYEVVTPAGASVVVASPRGGPAPIDPRGYPSAAQIGPARDALERLNATLPLSAVKATDFDAILLPGGHGPMFDLATDPAVKALIADFWTQGKVVGSVCHGTASLLNVELPGGSTLLHGRRVTAFTHNEDSDDKLFAHMPFSLHQRITREGADFVQGPAHEPHVEVDGRLVTGQNPQSALAFARAFMKAVRENGSAR